MKIRTVIFLDGRTDKIFDFDFVKGVSQEPIPSWFITKLRALGDGAPFQVLEMDFVPKDNKVKKELY